METQLQHSKLKRATIGDYLIALFCVLVILICILPMVTLLARSLSDPGLLIRNEIALLPKGFTLNAYQTILSDARYVRSLIWTAILTVMCTILSMFMTTIASFPLIYDHLKGRRVINFIFLFTMYFGAGTIPTYLVLKELNLIGSPLVLMLPYCLSVFNLIIMRSFLFGIPDSLRESAEIDGAGPIRILIKIYLPLSTSVIATLSLFYAVGRWNGYSDALMFMSRNRDYYPIQYLLYNIINVSASFETALTEGTSSTQGLSETFKAASVMFATVPILMIYPWLQRYFITGVTIGAEKG
ncbi:MAG: carbohydrate ABC transporter permease [Clostridiales bacterium]|jgi:putative aldouronate transport system permease protein|nr:carbohydrate ABC transporter permease [Clostridiales bacterium]